MIVNGLRDLKRRVPSAEPVADLYERTDHREIIQMTDGHRTEQGKYDTSDTSATSATQSATRSATRSATGVLN